MWSRIKRLGIVAAAALLVPACTGSSQQEEASPGGEDALTVMSRNLYVGTDVTSLATVSTREQLAAAVATILEEVEATDFTERAAAIADEIARYRPDLVGLQEVALWRTQSPPDGTDSPATGVAFDFLELLLGELGARGLDYEPSAVFDGADVEVEGRTFDVRLTDREVILARGDLTVTNAQTAPYETILELPSPLGGSLAVERGWASVDVQLGNGAVRFVTTHLEVGAFSSVQERQAEELLAILDDPELPAVLVGDFNSEADGTGTASYEILAESGLVDAWQAVRPDEAGFTCCHTPDLRNPEPTLDARIDLVLVSDEFHVDGVAVLGDETSDRTPSGLWPSDHAGVVASVSALR